MLLAQKHGLQVQGDVMYWKNTTGAISVYEAQEIAKEIRETVQSKNIKRVLVDNRELNGAWNPDVNMVWGELMAWLVQNIDKCATLCKTMVNKVQLERISRDAGTFDQVKAYTSEFDACRFLGLDKLEY